MSFFNYPTYVIPPQEDIDEVLITTPISVIVQESFYGEVEAALLTKILGAVHQQITDVAITKMSEGRNVRIISNDQLDQKSLIIVFGLTPQMCGLQIDEVAYKLIQLGKSTYLFSASLQELPSSPEARRALWMALKGYYDLK